MRAKEMRSSKSSALIPIIRNNLQLACVKAPYKNPPILPLFLYPLANKQMIGLSYLFKKKLDARSKTMNDLKNNVCTYNIGSGLHDYAKLYRHLNKPLIFNNETETQQFLIDTYNKVEKTVIDFLLTKTNIFCLQEVGSEQRPFIQTLRDRNFEIIHSIDPFFDTAIALDKDQFEEITNYSFKVCGKGFEKDVAVAKAIHKLSKESFVFVSAYVPGFDFMEKVDESASFDGDFYCREIVKKLSEIGSGNIQIIGADMNANPEKWEPRFQIFSEKTFRLYRKNAATNVNPNDEQEPQREIDFIFVKPPELSIWQKIKSIFISTTQFQSAEIEIQNTIEWNVDTNISDHMPVFANISYKNKISKIRQLWDAVCYTLSSYFRMDQKRKTT